MTNKSAPEPKPAVEVTEPDPNSASSDRARRREAALRRLKKSNGSRRTAIALGVTVIAAVAAITTAGSVWEPSPPAMDTAARPANLPATSTLAVCPGAPVLPEGAGEGEDLDFSPVSSDAATALSVAAASDLAGNIPGISYFAAETDPPEDPDSTQITDSLDEETQQGPPATAATDGTVTQYAHYDVIAEPADDADQPLALATEPVGGRPGTAAASSQYAATDGDLAGMSAAACTPAAHQHWLTGAITTPGTTAVLNLTNPSATNSTVDLAVFDPDGRVEASGTSGIVLAAGQTRSMLVAGLAPSQSSVAIEVSSSGGPVAADIQQHRLDGIVPAGVDTVQPAHRGSTVVIPGLEIPEDAEDIANDSGLDGQTPTLHVASTGAAASATVTLRDSDGPVEIPTEASAVELAPGEATTVDLTGVEPGTYAVEIAADSNVIASATSLAFNQAADNPDATGNTAAVDTAYMPSTAPIRGETWVALPALAEPSSQLVLTSDTEATVTITPVDSDGEHGEATTQELAADTAVSIQDDDAAAYLLDTGSNSVHAGVLVESEAGVSAMPVNTVADTGTGLPVRLGY